MQLWLEGKISGEMHLAIGEEAIAAGIVSQIEEGDALALDHRGTPQILMRGVNPLLVLKELLGHTDGLCNGKGGHMHLFSPPHLVASTGIVGASVPAALGFAISAQYLRPRKIAVAFFGEGAVNQGMVMESFNLAVSWNLPVVFVCKDNQWAITTPSDSVTAGNLTERAKGFSMDALSLDGSDIIAVYHAAESAIAKARKGGGPTFLHMTCVRPEGHFVGDPLIRISRAPLKEMKKIAGPLLKSVTKFKGSSLFERSTSLGTVTSTLGKTIKDQIGNPKDPIQKLRKELISDRNLLNTIESEIGMEIKNIVQRALQLAA